MELLTVLLFAVLICAVIWFVVYLIETKLSPTPEMVWFLRLAAIILTVIVLLRAIWPHVP